MEQDPSASMSSPDLSTEQAGAAGVKSAERVLSIFAYFEKHREPKTLSEISHDLGYPVSSTLALLRSIQASGYLSYDLQTKAYIPSLRFAMLGQWVHDRLFQDGAIVKMMEHLSAETGDTVLLGIQNGLQSQHIHIAHTSQSLRYHPPVGTLRPLLRSAVGRVLLAQQPRKSVVRLIERINASGADEGRRFSLTDVLADLETVRAQGYAFSANLFTEGAGIVAVALPPTVGDMMMAVSVGGPSTRINETTIPRLLDQIRMAVREFLPTTNDTSAHTAHPGRASFISVKPGFT